MAQWTDHSRSFLITVVRDRKIIWDREMGDAQGKNAKNQALQQVTDLLNSTFPSQTKFTNEDVRSQWKNLKDTFVRKQRWMGEGRYLEDPLKEPTWKFYRQLSFLEERIKRPKATDQSPNGYDMSCEEQKTDLHQLQHYDTAMNHTSTSSEEQMMIYNHQPSHHHQVSPPSPTTPTVSYPKYEELKNAVVPPAVNDRKRKQWQQQVVPPIQKQRKEGTPTTTMTTTGQDEFDLFGACVAAQLRRLCEEKSRVKSLQLQKRLSDVLYESQMEMLER